MRHIRSRRSLFLQRQSLTHKPLRFVLTSILDHISEPCQTVPSAKFAHTTTSLLEANHRPSANRIITHRPYDCSTITSSSSASSSKAAQAATSSRVPSIGTRSPPSQSLQLLPPITFRKRPVFDKHQRQQLEAKFVLKKYITKSDRKEMADRIGLNETQVMRKQIYSMC